MTARLPVIGKDYIARTKADCSPEEWKRLVEYHGKWIETWGAPPFLSAKTGAILGPNNFIAEMPSKLGNWQRPFAAKPENAKNGTQWLKQVYLDIADPTEYHFALKCFGDWDAYVRTVKDSVKFAKMLRRWRVELAARIRASALSVLMQDAMERKNHSTLRWIASGKWKQEADGSSVSAHVVTTDDQEALDKDEEALINELVKSSNSKIVAFKSK